MKILKRIVIYLIAIVMVVAGLVAHNFSKRLELSSVWYWILAIQAAALIISPALSYWNKALTKLFEVDTKI